VYNLGNRSNEISYATLHELPDARQPITDGDHKVQLEIRECSRRGCKKPALDDSELCRKHEDDQRRYNREYDARRRAEYEAAKQCTRCGAKERKPGSKWCPGCVIKLDRMRRRTRGADHKVQLENTKSARVAARLIAWENSPQNEGRMRMRGGKRGAPSLEDRDRRDLSQVQESLARYGAALDEAYSSEVRQLSKLAQERARREAHAKLALAVRLGMEALQTYGYDVPIAVPVDEGEIDDDEDDGDDA
jgi:hypothetical protein